MRSRKGGVALAEAVLLDDMQEFLGHKRFGHEVVETLGETLLLFGG